MKVTGDWISHAHRLCWFCVDEALLSVFQRVEDVLHYNMGQMGGEDYIGYLRVIDVRRVPAVVRHVESNKCERCRKEAEKEQAKP